MKIEALFFDLDGTLVDSVPDLAAAVDDMLLALELQPAGIEQVRNWVGNGADKLVERALYHAAGEDRQKQLFPRAKQIFLEKYRLANGCRSLCYPGVETTLAALKNRGFRLACITNKPARFTHPLLRQLGLDAFFELVVSGDTLPVKKPEPLPLTFCAERMVLPLQACCMVGDSFSDVGAARAAGLPVVAVGYGYNHGEDIRSARPDACISRFEQLLELEELAPVFRAG